MADDKSLSGLSHGVSAMVKQSSGAVTELVVYPEGNSLPRSDNTMETPWIVGLYGNLAALYREAPEIFVARDFFWYPVENHPEIVIAPALIVIFGRPKGDRGSSYRQWLEANIPVTVAFDVLSPKNTVAEMTDKLAFYEDYGVEVYYVYDPDTGRLLIYLRSDNVLQRQRQLEGFVSPRLGISFDVSRSELIEPFLTFEGLHARWDNERKDRIAAERRAAKAEQRARRLAELGRKARSTMVSVEELAELKRLEGDELP
jgi:Uma2 family endonuclease